ncbi:ABC transporter substrate-binding protein [Acidimicrobiia bacterium EGI L10123]|uniref:ABC transporter substrate-binding protein n=1 Tax=Salinilacustrithrix flava TaxID=2957203 RepID=UPI003D7C16BD|nr:ABC transporter substrate-binding protein [Acidimicrobiia bacterium EGI L10123]
MHTPSRWRPLLALVLIASLVLAACGGENSGEAAEDTGSSGDGTAEAAVPGEIDREGTLRLIYTVAPTSYDPHRGSSSTDNTSLNLVFDRLVHTTPDGDPIPGLATEWTLEAEPPSMSLTLREDVTFHDGTPFDAEAAKVNLDRARAEDSNVASDLVTIESVEVVDTHDIKLNLTEPGGALPLILSDRGGMMMSPASFDDPNADRQPVGAGMYRVTDYEVGVQTSFERYEDYWDPEAAAAAKVELTYQADDSTRLNALLGGQADWVNVAAGDISTVEDEGMVVTSEPDLALYHMQLNLARSEFDDPLVREALNFAVDREGLAEAIFDGRATPSVQPFPEGYFANEPDVADTYTYDPERARELLAEAGLEDGFSFELLTAQLDGFVRVSEALQAQLAEVGIDVTLNVVPVNEVVQTAYLDKVGDAVMITFQGRPDPSQTLGRLYSEGGPSNPSGESSPAFMEAYDLILSATDEDARVEAIREASVAVVDDALDVVLLHANANYAMRSEVVGFAPYITAKPEFRGVGVAG